MSIDVLGTIFTFAGGLGMFLYGMNVMGDGLQKAAGNKMRHYLGLLTNHRILGVVVGALITAIIQSSSATTVMVVGFVNAGLMNLTQAVGVIMGANIGTTITSWIVSMNEWEWATILKPSFFAPVLIGIGAFMGLFSKSEGKKDVGEILVGFGVLFVGLDFMSSSIEPYSDSPIFSNTFRVLGKSPILGVIAGALVTAIIQSSSASVGILQTLAMNGIVNWNSAIFITLGQNIGTCVTALLSSAGANKTAKRAATIHLLFNSVGTIIFGVIMYFVFLFNSSLANSEISSVQISIFHSVFNIANTILLYPFAGFLVKLSGILIKDEADDSDDEVNNVLRHLDERIFESPSFAVENVEKEVAHMGEITLENLRRSIHSLLEGDKDEADEVFQQEKVVDTLDNIITEYLIKIANLSLTEKQQLIVNHLFNTVSDIERVGDHAENIAELTVKKCESNLKFTKDAYDELKDISDVAILSFENAMLARENENIEYFRKVAHLEDEVDNLEEEYRERHIKRLSGNKCGSEPGVLYMDMLVNLERVSDHAMNIVNYLKDEID